MDSNQNVLYAVGLPALISTGITLIYFLLKACCFAFYALSHKTEGRLPAATPGRCQQEHRSIEGEEGHTEVYEQVSGDNTEQYGTGAQRPSGSLPVPRRRQDLCLSSRRDVTEYPEKPAFRQNEKRLPGGRSGSTTNYYGPVVHMMTPQEYIQKGAAGQMPQMANHQMMKELVEKNGQTKILMMEFRDIEHPKPK